MKANEFVRAVGLDNARLVLSGNDGARYFGCTIETAKYWISGSNEYHILEIFFPNMSNQFALDLDELKRLVESHELVEKMGGLDGAKGEYFEIVHSGSYGEIHPVTLAKAIADVESCQ